MRAAREAEAKAEKAERMAAFLHSHSSPPPPSSSLGAAGTPGRSYAPGGSGGFRPSGGGGALGASGGPFGGGVRPFAGSVGGGDARTNVYLSSQFMASAVPSSIAADKS